MINLLNNKFKFKEKYLSLHKKFNVNPKNFNNILKKKIINLYYYSYNLNKFLKNILFIIKGFCNNLIYLNIKLPKIISESFIRSKTLNFKSKAISAFINSASLFKVKDVDLFLNNTSKLGQHRSSNLSPLNLHLSSTSTSIILKSGRSQRVTFLIPARYFTTINRSRVIILSDFSNTVLKRDMDQSHPYFVRLSSYNFFTGTNSLGEHLNIKVYPKSIYFPPKPIKFFSTETEKENREICIDTTAKEWTSKHVHVNKREIGFASFSHLENKKNGSKLFEQVEGAREKNINKEKLKSSLSSDSNIKKLFKKNISLRNWGQEKNWSKKKKKWFSFLDKIRQIIKSKYVFNAFLANSQSINYNFNKNFKKTDLNSIYKILKYFFTSLSSLISKPVFLFSSDKINIRLFYFIIPSLPKLKKERKINKFIRNKGKLYEEKKNRREFRKIMKNFKMKLFIARWKENNNLIRLPNLLDTVSKFISSSNQYSDLPISLLPNQQTSTIRPLIAKVYSMVPVISSNTTYKVQTADIFNLNDRHLESIDLLNNIVSKNKLTEGDLSESKREIKFNKIEQEKNFFISPSNSYTLLTQFAEESNLNAPVRNGVGDKFSEVELEEAVSSYPFYKVEEGGRGDNFQYQNLLNEGFKSLQLLKNRDISTMVSLNKDKLKYLVFILEKAFNKTIILDLVRLKYPYHESNILSQILGLSSKNKNFRKMMRKLLYTATIKNPTKMIRKQNFSIIPSYLSGIKVRLAGRLITQRVVPRFTVQSIQIGSLARGKINYVDTSRFTHKNKRGAFSFTVTTSHIFENYK